MYKAIAGHPTVSRQYSAQLVRQGVLSQANVDELRAQAASSVREAHGQSIRHKVGPQAWLANSWQGRAIELATTPGLAVKAASLAVRPFTGVHTEVLRSIGRVITTVPEGFALHGKGMTGGGYLGRLITQRRESIASGTGINWCVGHVADALITIDNAFCLPMPSHRSLPHL